MTNNDLPLFTFFDALRKNGFSLGIGEYYALLDALQLGFGIDKEKGVFDKILLLKICKLLWLKPNQSKFVFENLFEENYQDFIDSNINQEGLSDKPKTNSPSKNCNKTAENKENKNSRSSTNYFPPVKLVYGEAAGNPISIGDDNTKAKRKFYFWDNYFDLSKRQMQQVCRFLPLAQPSLTSQEIDIDASVDHLAEQGVLLAPVYKSQKRIVNEVLLLIDHQGSMLAFDVLVKNFTNALQAAFKTDKQRNKDRVSVFYFHNIPTQHLYINKAHTEYEPLSRVIEHLDVNQSMVILLSDASAARGGNSTDRFKASLRFILQLKKVTQKIVWLNPLPKTRWQGTTAERIARIVPMFSLTTQHDLQDAINVLRGK